MEEFYYFGRKNIIRVLHGPEVFALRSEVLSPLPPRTLVEIASGKSQKLTVRTNSSLRRIASESRL